ncbi:MAG: Flp family type IVb pilin [Candidatus Alkaliphilus sp. MAG34]
MDHIKGFLADEDGQGLVEYGLILFLIVIAAIASLGLAGESIKEILYDKTASEFERITEDF